MSIFKKIVERNRMVNESQEEYHGDEMTIKELKIAINSAKEIIDMLEYGETLKRWQISAIVKASEELSSVYASMAAETDDEEEYESPWMESFELDEGVEIKTKQYDWGKMMTVHDGNNNRFPLHPEHQEKIKNLDHGKSVTFKTETGKLTRATRKGSDISLKSNTSNKSVVVPHSVFKEEYATEIKETYIPLSHVKKHIDAGNTVKYHVLHNGKDAAGKFDDYESAKKGASAYRGRMKKQGYDHSGVAIHPVVEEVDFKVSVDGLPDMYLKGNSPSEVKTSLRKIVKKPDMIRSVDRVTSAMIKKIFRDKAAGKDDVEE